MKDQSNTHSRRKILIAYASHFGTTAKVAETIGDVLRADGNRVDTKPIETIRNLNGYDAVVIGSAIQYDKWLPDAREFVRSNQDVLKKLPVAFFFTCLALSRQNEKSRRQAQIYSDGLAASFSEVNPVGIGRFAGVLDYSKIPFLLGLAARIMFAYLGVKEGDHRDWPAIRAWAKRISVALSS